MNGSLLAAPRHVLAGAPATPCANPAWPGPGPALHRLRPGSPGPCAPLRPACARDAGHAPPTRLVRLLAAVKAWHQRSRDRRELDALDERLLRDIGLTRDWAMVERRKYFW